VGHPGHPGEVGSGDCDNPDWFISCDGSTHYTGNKTKSRNENRSTSMNSGIHAILLEEDSNKLLIQSRTGEVRQRDLGRNDLPLTHTVHTGSSGFCRIHMFGKDDYSCGQSTQSFLSVISNPEVVGLFDLRTAKSAKQNDSENKAQQIHTPQSSFVAGGKFCKTGGNTSSKFGICMAISGSVDPASEPNSFTAGYENGSVVIWDARKSSEPVKSWMAFEHKVDTTATTAVDQLLDSGNVAHSISAMTTSSKYIWTSSVAGEGKILKIVNDADGDAAAVVGAPVYSIKERKLNVESIPSEQSRMSAARNAQNNNSNRVSNRIVVRPDRKVVMCLTWDGCVRFYTFTGKLLHSTKLTPKLCCSDDFRNVNRLMEGSAGGLSKGPAGSRKFVHGASFCEENNHFAICTEDGRITVSDFLARV